MSEFENVAAWMIAGGDRNDCATGSQPAPGPLARLGRLVGSLAARAAGAVRRQAAAGPSCCPA